MAADYLGGGTSSTHGQATGYQFTVSETLMVNWLGLHDVGSDGSAPFHDVGIFRSSDQSAVLTTTLGSGTSGTFFAGTVDGSRMNQVSALLQPGVGYYILSNNFSSDFSILAAAPSSIRLKSSGVGMWMEQQMISTQIQILTVVHQAIWGRTLHTKPPAPSLSLLR